VLSNVNYGINKVLLMQPPSDLSTYIQDIL